MNVDELHLLIGYLREDFKEFKKNEFAHLVEKVDRLSIRVALIVGAISALTVVANILVRILG